MEPLIKALDDENFDVRWFVTETLGKIGDSRAVEPLIKALGDEVDDIRTSAANALLMIGEPAVEPLIKDLGEDETLKTVDTRSTCPYRDRRASSRAFN